MELYNLQNAKGARRRPRRLGKGLGSSLGKTCGRGQKGQKSRTGVSFRRGFEGGQTPLYRQLPKRGFTSFTLHAFAPINVEKLNIFENGTVVTPSELRKRGLLNGLKDGVKVLGQGDLKKKLTVVANAFSESAKKKIQGAKGECRRITESQARNDYDGVAALDAAKAEKV